jgi:hypothetical protein
MVHPQVEDGGTKSKKKGSSEYTASAVMDS